MGNGHDELLAELEVCETRVWETLVRGDKLADAQALHADFLGVYTDGFAAKADHVQQLEDGPTIKTFELSDCRVLPLGHYYVVFSYKAGFLKIGFVQGGLGGVGLWVAGVEGVAFWSVIMVVLSVTPAVGPSLALIPIAIALMIDGQMTAGVGLAVWEFAVVGTIDNILRPMLVGREAALHDLMILISTLGGLAALGAVGLVLGPVLAGLFVSLWDTLKTSLALPAQTSDALDAKSARGRVARV